jgi:hypothetical protein
MAPRRIATCRLRARRELHRGHDVGNAGSADDGERAFVDHAVPNLARLIAPFGGQANPAARSSGLFNKQIAVELGTTEKTIKFHPRQCDPQASCPIPSRTW